jgi:hypothetical protein
VNTIEDRLRDAYRTAAETIQPGTLRDLRSQPAETARGRGKARTRRLLIPLAAAVAVTAVVTGLALTGSLLGAGDRQHATSELGPDVPRFYVQAAPAQVSREAASLGLDPLHVYDTATGKVVSTIHAPKGTLLSGNVVALADDRTFLTAAYPGSVQTDLIPPGQCLTHLYEFHLSDAGEPTPLSQLPITIPGQLTSLSVTPDGRMIAYATELSCAPTSGTRAQIGVINVTTHQARSWPMRLLSDFSIVENVALSADGRELAFSERFLTANADTRVARILPTNALAGSYDERSTVMPRSADTMWAAPSADGASVYTCSFPNSKYGLGRSSGRVTYRINSIASGRRQVLVSFPAQRYPICGASLDTSGRYLLIQLTQGQPTCPQGVTPAETASSVCENRPQNRLVVEDLHTGRVTDLPHGGPSLGPLWGSPASIAW